MSKPIPTIQKYMTTAPHTIGKDQTLATAEKMMIEHNIRHLPVLDGGKLLSIISDRDIKYLKGFKDVDPHKILLSDMSFDEVFTVTPDSKLDEVCDIMAENKFGSALVLSNKTVVGIFTWIDALRAMSDLLKSRLQS